MTKALLFDFFGTLVDYKDRTGSMRYDGSYRALCRAGFTDDYETYIAKWEQAYSLLTTQSVTTLREFHMGEAVRLILAPYQPEVHEELVNEIVILFLDEWNKGVTYKTGVAELLALLGKQFRLGLISNTHYAPLVLGHLRAMKIHESFSDILLSVEYGRRKPESSIFLESLRRLQVQPHEGLYIGDSYTDDYCGAQNANMRCLLIDPGRKYDIPPQNRIESIFEIPIKLVEHANARS